METLITKGIKVDVEVEYQTSYSDPKNSVFTFVYHITLENLSNSSVQLKSRHWYIQESSGITREVKGEGVVGQQPILEPGETYQYSSWSQINSYIGRMLGTYQFHNLYTEEEFEVKIPAFLLINPAILN